MAAPHGSRADFSVHLAPPPVGVGYSAAPPHASPPLHPAVHPDPLPAPIWLRQETLCVSKRQQVQHEFNQRNKEDIVTFWSQRAMEAELIQTTSAKDLQLKARSVKRVPAQPPHPPTPSERAESLWRHADPRTCDRPE